VVRAFKRSKGKRLASKLDSSTLRGFGGGWNSIDEDLSMKPNFQVSLINFHRTTSGAQAVRFGSKFKVDIKDVHNSPIIDGTYYNTWNIIVCQSGVVLKVSENGSTKTIIWGGFPADTVVDGPLFKQVSFVPFKDTLIIHTGKTKPLEIKPDMTCNYLGDPIGGNVNTPVGKFGCVAANYHCVANIVETARVPPITGPLTVTKRKTTEIYISSKGTSGVFPGDAEPNDAISIDVGAYAPEGAATIRGIAGFRTYLLVFLQNITLQVKLGDYDDADNHTPKFPDTLPQFGILGNRTIVTVENDIMFCGLSGLASAKRNLYSPDSITSDYLSTAIAPTYRRIVGALTDDEQLNLSFAAFDRLNNDFLLFMPNGRVLCYTFNPRLKMHSWSQYDDMDWSAAWTSILGRLFLAKGTKIFLGGNGTFDDENFYADRLNDRDVVYTTSAMSISPQTLVYDSVTDEVWRWTKTQTNSKPAGLTFEQERTNNPNYWVLYEGNKIEIEMELPWIDGKDPLKLKQLRYVSIATKGDAEFTFDVYVDNLYKDVEGNVIHAPSVTMAFIGNDAYGYGFDDDPYGMGRRSRDPRLFGLPVKFKTVKFKVWGATDKKLEIVNLSFLYARNRVSGYVR
jgi:hypothetical protein